jgi:hypothetical protein
MERAQVVAADVEGAVAIEEAGAAPLGHLAAEPEVLIEPFLFRQFRHDPASLILGNNGGWLQFRRVREIGRRSLETATSRTDWEARHPQ